VTGFFLTLQPNPVPATLSAGGQLMSMFAGTFANMLHCNGTPACTSVFNLLGLTATESVPIFTQYSVSGTATWTGAPSALQISFQNLFLGVLPVRTTFTGQEISRTFVPEPSPALLLGGALLVLVAGRAFLLRRHR
jgi:hypothetical protein